MRRNHRLRVFVVVDIYLFDKELVFSFPHLSHTQEFSSRYSSIFPYPVNVEEHRADDAANRSSHLGWHQQLQPFSTSHPVKTTWPGGRIILG